MRAGPMSSPKVYPITRFTSTCLLILPLMGIVFVSFAFLTLLPAINESITDSVVSILIAMAFFVFITYVYVVLRRVRLVISYEGIAFYGWGYRMYTPWYNVIGTESLSFSSPVNFRKFAGLKLRQKALLNMKLEDGIQQGIAVLETDWWNPAWNMARFAGIFPIGNMVGGFNWREGELGAVIRYYAPQAFEV